MMLLKLLGRDSTPGQHPVLLCGGHSLGIHPTEARCTRCIQIRSRPRLLLVLKSLRTTRVRRPRNRSPVHGLLSPIRCSGVLLLLLLNHAELKFDRHSQGRRAKFKSIQDKQPLTTIRKEPGTHIDRVELLDLCLHRQR